MSKKFTVECLSDKAKELAETMIKTSKKRGIVGEIISKEPFVVEFELKDKNLLRVVREGDVQTYFYLLSKKMRIRQGRDYELTVRFNEEVGA